MMNYRQLYLGFAALLAASCTQEIELEETAARSPYEKVQITAGTPMTRMTAEKDGQLTHFNWNRGDMIALATSEQQLPYITHNDGSTATFLSALGSSASKDDYLNDKEGSVVYARYPYKDTQPVDMETLTTPVSLGTPLLYAVDTLQDGKLDLHFHHAMAYLRFHVQHDILRTEDSISTWFEMSFDYERDRFPISGQFDYKTKSIQPTDSTWRWQLPLSLLSDTVSLYPIFPFKSNRKFVFELGQEDVSMPETNTDAYYYSKSVLKDLPSGGLQAGHVYDVYLDYRDGSNFLRQLYESTNGWNWTNNTNWLSDKPYDEWYGITSYDCIDLRNNNLTGDAILKEFKYGLLNVMLQGNALNSVTIEDCDIDFGYSFTGLEGISLRELTVINGGLNFGQGFLGDDSISTNIDKITFKNMTNMGRLFLDHVISDEVTVYNCHFEDQGVWINRPSSVKTMVFENSTMGGGLGGDGLQSLVIKDSELREWWATSADSITIINSTIEGHLINISGSGEDVGGFISGQLNE